MVCIPTYSTPARGEIRVVLSSAPEDDVTRRLRRARTGEEFACAYGKHATTDGAVRPTDSRRRRPPLYRPAAASGACDDSASAVPVAMASIKHLVGRGPKTWEGHAVVVCFPVSPGSDKYEEYFVIAPVKVFRNTSRRAFTRYRTEHSRFCFIRFPFLFFRRFLFSGKLYCALILWEKMIFDYFLPT